MNETVLPFWPSWLTGRAGWLFLAGLFALLGLLKLLLSRPPRVRAINEAGQVIGIVGRKGSGKSYLAVKLARDQLVAGANVVSNFTVYLDQLGPTAGTWAHFSGWEQFTTIRGDFKCPSCGPLASYAEKCPTCGKRTKVYRRTVVIIDEVQGYAPSWEKRPLPPGVRPAMANGRKYGVDLYWISQHEARVSTALKYDTNLMYVCGRSGRNFTAECFEPEHVRKKDRQLYRMRYKFDPAIAALYDTLEIVDVDDFQRSPAPAAGRPGVPAWLPPELRAVDGG